MSAFRRIHPEDVKIYSIAEADAVSDEINRSVTNIIGKLC